MLTRGETAARGWLARGRGPRARYGSACALVFATALRAFAAPAPEAPKPSVAPESDPPLAPGRDPRPRPDYGSPPEHRPWTDHLLWIPRTLLAPVYVASDLVSRPLTALAVIAEKNHWRVHLYEFFTFGENHQVGVFPTGRIDTGFDPSLGVYVFWNDVWGSSDLRARATTGGSDWWSANAQWRVPLGRETLAFAVEFSKRPDSAFHGLGKDSSAEAARFDEQRLETRIRYRAPLGSRFAMTTIIGQQWLVFDADGATGGETSLAEAIDTGRFSAPPALDGGVLALSAAAFVDFDTRTGRFTPRPRAASDYDHVSGTGVAGAAYVSQHVGLRRTRASPSQPAQLPSWIGYGARAVGTLDVTGRQRRLELELYAAFTDPLPGAGDVPFTEQVSLGGSRPLRGFGGRRLLDRSGAAATLRYRWPVWSALDGVLHCAAGNVFGPRLRDFALQELRASFGAGITTAAAADQSFEILWAFGTEVFEAGGAIESTRLTVGTSANF